MSLMAFGVKDFRDLFNLLEQRPDLRAQARTLLLSEDVLTLPATVSKLAEAQLRTEARLEQLTERVDKLTERVDKLTDRVDKLTERVDQLAEAQQRTEARLEQLTERVGRLAEAQQQTVLQLSELSQAHWRIEKRFHELSSEFRGDKLERKYRDNAPGYFGRILQRSRAVSKEDLDSLLPPGGEGLTEEERDRLFAADLVIRGIRPEDRNEAYLAVEVSVLVELHDVARARDRARLLQKATGRITIPVVAGDNITEEARQVAADEGVWCVLNGAVTAPQVGA